MGKRTEATALKAAMQIVTRLERKNRRLQKALAFFADRRFAILAKFDLHGPKDMADALRTTFKSIEKL